MKKHTLNLVLLALLVLASTAQAVKLIDLSWYCPSVDFLEQYLSELEQNTPLDGLTIAFDGTPITVNEETYRPRFWNVWNKVPWQLNYFSDFINRMKAIHFQRFKDNFLYLTTNEADFNWFSDAEWNTVAANFGIAATIAKETGMKGFLFDIEQYGYRFWEHDATATGISFSDAEAVAFRRGQQWGNQVFGVFPNIIIFMPFCLSAGKSDTSLANAFLNGILDVMPPQALIYEGDEWPSYHAKNRNSYQQLRKNLQKYIQNYAYSAYQEKARRQMKLAPGFYMDAYFHFAEDTYWPQALQPDMSRAATRVKYFCNNLKEAAEVADTYVWLYSEHRSWWWTHGTTPQADEIWSRAPNAQGLYQAINKVKSSDKKMIEVGWDCVDAAFLARNASRMKRLRPLFDGVIFTLSSCTHPFRQNSLDETKYANDLVECENIAGGPLTENFIKMYSDGDASQNLDWFDDDRWAGVISNVTKMAHCGALAECKGLLIDFEAYSTCPWSYAQATRKDSKTFEEYEARLRQCGAQFIQAIESEMPGVTLFSFWNLSGLTQYYFMDEEARRARLKADTGYNLLPAFIDGIMDAASTNMTLIDGNENAYYYETPQQFQKGYEEIKNGSVNIISTANTTNYLRKIRAAQTMYMDRIFDLGDKNRDSLSRYLTLEEQCQFLVHNTFWALNTTDKYVWCYSEHANWWLTEEEKNYPNCYRDGNGLDWWGRVATLNTTKSQAAIQSAIQKFRNNQPLGFDIAMLQDKANRRLAKVYQRNGVPLPDSIRAINQCANGDFESDWANWGQNCPTAPYATYSFNLSTESPFHGSKCINLAITQKDFDGRTGHARAYHGIMSLSPNIPYVLDVAYKTDDGAEGGYIWTVPGYTNVISSVTLPPTNGEWKRFVIRGVTPDSTGIVTLYLELKELPTKGKIWFDDLVFVPEADYDRLMNATYQNPPTITLSADTSTPSNIVPLTITTNKACNLCYSTNGATNWIDCTNTLHVTKNGTYKIMAIDENGLTDFKSITFSNIQEETGPSIILTADATTPTIKTKLTVSTDTISTILYNTVSSDYEGKWTTYSKDIPIVENGTYYFKARDAYGFESSNAITFSNIYERPEITLTANSETPTQQTTLAASTESGLAIFYSQKYTGPWKRYTTPIPITENGIYYFKTEKDSVGQIGEAFIQFKNIDHTPPFLLLTGHTNRKATSALLSASYDRTATVQFNTDSADYTGEWTDYTGAITVTANATYFFRATDPAGNVTEKAITFNNITPSRMMMQLTRHLPSITTEDHSGNEADEEEEPPIDLNQTTMPKNAPQIVTGETNDQTDVFVGKANGVWQSGYQATHVGTLGDEWEGTKEAVSLKGKNKILDIFTGSEDASILLLTDDANGDALFLDDIFSALPDELDSPLARIAGIDEIFAGDGDDIIDMTSQEFLYLGEGMTIHGGNGNDTIWANKGRNSLNGDAGDDRLVGASGDDILDGGTGNDSIHGGGGNDTVRLCDNWGHDTVEQLSGGTITILLPANVQGIWNSTTMTFTSEDGENSITIIGIPAEDVVIGR